MESFSGYWELGSIGVNTCMLKQVLLKKAKELSAYVKPNPFKAFGSIRMELTFMREGRFDTIEYDFSETAYKAKTYYVRFVPRKNRREWIPNWLIVGNEQKFDGHYGRTPNGLLLLLILYSNGLFVFSDVCP